MTLIRRWALISLTGLFTLVSHGVSAAQASDPILYSLRSGSAFDRGCFGPCMCPVLSSTKMEGTFSLRRTSIDPLFEHYGLLNIDWLVTLPDSVGVPPRVVHVTGKGSFDLGGEVALTQRLTLDVSFDGRPPWHFDSGFTPVQAAFPAIDCMAFLHANACFDTAFRVLAAPVGVSDVTNLAGIALLREPTPNPSRSEVRTSLVLSRPAWVRADVLDIGGRVVAHLLDGELSAGERALVWSGARTSGGDAGSGIFWIRARAGGNEAMRRIVRVK